MKWHSILLLACSAAGALAAETAQERGKRVVDEALKALGGEAFLRMEDRVESGRAYSFFRQQLAGLSVAKLYTRYLTRPAPPVPSLRLTPQATSPSVPEDLYLRERQAFGKDESNYVLFSGSGAWEVTFRGARPLEDQRYANYRDSTKRNIFYILRQRLGEPGLDFYSQGSDLWENRPVEKVEITDADNAMVTVYFDQLSKLPVRQVFRRRNPQYQDFDTEVTGYAKYRDVGGGVKWPFDVRRDRNGEKIFEMYADSVEINRNLTDDRFTLPANIKMLPKAR